jgi:hypothetical protein
MNGQINKNGTKILYNNIYSLLPLNISAITKVKIKRIGNLKK